MYIIAQMTVLIMVGVAVAYNQYFNPLPNALTYTHTHVQDVEDLAKECEDELQESKASARLGRKVDAMIGRLDQALQEVEDDLVSTSPESPTVQMIQKEK
jgi:hypothetical protein